VQEISTPAFKEQVKGPAKSVNSLSFQLPVSSSKFEFPSYASELVTEL